MKTIAYYEAIQDNKDSCTPIKSSYYVTKSHFHRCFEILFITNGTAELSINEKSFKTYTGNIIFIHQYQIHSIIPSNDYRMLGVIVGTNFSNDFSTILNNYTLPPVLNDNQFNEHLLQYFEKIQKTKSKNTLIRKGFVNVIIGNLISHYKHVPIEKTHHINLIIDVLNYIDAHYNEPFSLEEIAKNFGYNKSYFSRLFNANTGKHLNTYVNEVRLQKLLEKANTNKKVTLYELVFDCGFESMTTFYRCFSKHYKESPAKFIRNGFFSPDL